MRLAVASLIAASVVASSGEVPKIDSLFPAGGQSGSEFEVSVTGTLKPWPLSAVCEDPRITFVPIEKEEGKFRVKIGADVEPGASLVRFFNADGSAAPRQFVVGAAAERTQTGTELLEIAGAELPLMLNGKLESGGDVDRFAIDLQAGQILVADVVAYAIDSPLDPLLHLCAPSGERLAFNHDATPIGLDPRLVFKAPAAGRYELQLSAFAYPPQANIRFAGGASAIYRLKLSNGLPEIALPDAREAEGEEAQEVSVPAEIGGRIEPAGDVDRFKFSAKKGEIFRIEVVAAQIGSWMDAVLVIEDSAGKESKRQDDIDSKTQHDVSLDWTAPSDGAFVAKVMDLNGVGGAEIAYQFQIARLEPSFSVTSSTSVVAVTAGEKVDLAVKAARHHGYKGELEVGIRSLPDGVTAAPVAVAEKGGEVKLSIVADASAAPSNGPISIWIAPKGAKPEERVDGEFELKGVSADAGDLLVNRTNRAWLTVLAKK